MKFAVENLDYDALVGRMRIAGLDNMTGVLAEQTKALGTPQWANEITFFWRSLYNAARKEGNEAVWLWFVTQPHIRHFAPAGAENYTIPACAPEATLPLIGGIDDTPYEPPAEQPKVWPAEPTPENLAEQTAALDKTLRELSEGREEVRCHNVAEYVATFYHSGTGQMLAKTQMVEYGFLALATDDGIAYLRATYPPAQ